VPDPVTVEIEITSSQNMPIFLTKSIDTDVDLTCTVMLKSEVNIPVNVRTEWSRVGYSFQRNPPTSMDTLNTYSSMITIRSINVSNAGDYRCRATVSKTSSRYITGEGKKEANTTLSLCTPF
jgi:hypothetical protein